MFSTLRKLFCDKIKEARLGLLVEEDNLSWVRVCRAEGQIVDQGRGKFDQELSRLDGEAKVLLGGRTTFYCLVEAENLQPDALESRIPFPAGTYQVRSLSVPSLQRPGKQSQFVAVARNEGIAQLRESLESHGLRVGGMEVAPTVLARLSKTLDLPPQSAFLHVHLGSRSTKIVISQDGYPYEARELSKGFRDMLFHYAMFHKSSEKEALNALQSEDLAKVPAVEPIFLDLIQEIVRTTRTHGTQIEYLTVTGYGCLEGLGRTLAERLNAHHLERDWPEGDLPLLRGLAQA